MSQPSATMAAVLLLEDPEREPLLLVRPQVEERKRERTPLPKVQLTVVLLLQVVERTSIQVIVPFINQIKLVRELDITGGDPKKVGYYVGLIGSLFYAGQAVSILAWSRTSDIIGRKPVLLIGLMGLCISMTCFGLSKTFWGLALSRCAAGLLDGNLSVIKSVIGDITDSSNRPAAFAFVEILWATGGTVGSFAGGVLARPSERFPSLFDNSFWRTYPYLLSCLFAAFFAAFSFIVASLCLEETIKPRQHSSVLSEESQDAPPIRSLLKPPVIISITNYCVTAFVDVCLFPLFPLFYATPIEVGGLGLDPFQIALCLSAYGIVNGIIQILFFAKIIEKFGPRSLIIAGTMIYPLVLAMFPVMNLLSRSYGVSPIVWTLLGFQLLITVGFDMSFGAIFLFVTASAPNKRSLGSVNGMAQTTVSITRTFGPALSESLFALSLQRDWLGGNAVYAILMILPLVSFFFASRLPRHPWVHGD